MQGVIDVSGDRLAWSTRWAEVQRMSVLYPSAAPVGLGITIASATLPKLDLTELVSVTVNNGSVASAHGSGSENELILSFTTGAPLYYRISDIRERDCWLESLRVCCISARSPNMPMSIPTSSVRACIAALQWLRLNPSSIEGPFRENGERRHTYTLWQALAIQGMAAIPTSVTVDGRIAADLVKGILRRLPESLLTNALFAQFRAASTMNSADQLVSLSYRLPPTNQQLLQLLFACLSSLVSASSVTRLDAHNLTTLLSPCLLPEDDASSLRDIGKTSPLLFMFQTFIAQPQLLETKAGVGLGLQSMSMSPMNASSPNANLNSIGDEKKSNVSISMMPPLMSPTSLASPAAGAGLQIAHTPSAMSGPSSGIGAPTPYARGVSSAAGTPAAGSNDPYALTLPVDAEKNVKLMKRGTKEIIIAHQYEYVRGEEFVAFATELAELEKHHSPQLEVGLRTLASALHGAEAHRMEVTAQLQKHIVQVARDAPPQLKEYRTATSKRSQATKSVHQKERAYNQAKQKNAKNVDVKAGDLERETLKLKQAERDMLQQEALRLARLKSMLKTYVDNHIYLYSRTIENLSGAYAATQQIQGDDDAKNIVSHLVSLQDYPSLD